MHPTLTIALRAARAAADKLSYVTNNFPALLAEGDSKQQIIAKAMDDAQFRIEQTIGRAYDDVGIFFTHKHLAADNDKQYWVINILSGSKNFLSGFPYFCVIVSQYSNGKIENTAVVNPLDNNEFIASRGRGAQYNEKRIRCGDLRETSQALIAHTQSLINPKLDIGHKRLTGCSVLDIAYTAAGVLDACFAEVDHPSDLEAALLIAHESGCLSGQINGMPLNKKDTQAVVSNAKLFKHLIIK